MPILKSARKQCGSCIPAFVRLIRGNFTIYTPQHLTGGSTATAFAFCTSTDTAVTVVFRWEHPRAFAFRWPCDQPQANNTPHGVPFNPLGESHPVDNPMRATIEVALLGRIDSDRQDCWGHEAYKMVTIGNRLGVRRDHKHVDLGCHVWTSGHAPLVPCVRTTRVLICVSLPTTRAHPRELIPAQPITRVGVADTLPQPTSYCASGTSCALTLSLGERYT